LKKDKKIEIDRYDQRALQVLNYKKNSKKKIKDYINAPYQYYFPLLKKLKKTKLLEIGAGIGQNTLRLIKMNFDVCATDISPRSVDVMSQKYSKYKNFSSKVADMEKLPFKNESFDIICSAGSLSYGDNNRVMNEIYRVLKFGGGVVLVDSLNDNPIYRFNRYINYIKGNRSWSTLKRMPNINLIDKYIKKFGYGKVKFFGSITWAFPLLKIVLSTKLITKFSNWVDQTIKVKKSAFKFVLILSKEKK
jgi:ubiquinone/menaquinone biosynthesis C-methylase UbiE